MAYPGAMMAAVDHSHGPEAAMSDDADPLYRPLGGFDEWAVATVDETGWADAVRRFEQARADTPAWAAMVDQGMRLAAAHRSGALDGLYPVDGDLVLALLRGEAALGSVGEAVHPHVRANVEALALAGEVDITEGSIQRIHAVACRPQLTHEVRVGDRVQDHVLAGGDYKHHPNHLRDAGGHWHPTAPVAQVEAEMANLVEQVGTPAFAELHPAVQAAWLRHAVLHIQPFADGNGRVARALASARLLRAASVPFLPPAHAAPPGSPAEAVELVGRAVVDLIDLLTSAPPGGPALDRWMREEAAADDLRRAVIPAVTEAIGRYSGGRADLSAAQVIPGDAIVVQVPPGVEEVITVDAHRDGAPVLLNAVEAGLRLEAGDPLGPWLDRVVSTLALRVAADLE